jgi:hypothetical protein
MASKSMPTAASQRAKIFAESSTAKLPAASAIAPASSSQVPKISSLPPQSMPRAASQRAQIFAPRREETSPEEKENPPKKEEKSKIAPVLTINRTVLEFEKLFTSYLSPKGEGNIMFENFKIKVPTTSDENKKIIELKKASIIHAFLNNNPAYVQRNTNGIWVYGVDNTTLPASEWEKMFSKLT